MKRIVLLLAAACLAARPGHAAVGGPDGFGYTWADSDEPGIVFTTPNFTTTNLRNLGFTGDNTVIQIALPATAFPSGFPYYGRNYTSFWLSSNGWLSFVTPAGNSVPTPANLPTPGRPDATVAFLWDDWTLDFPTALQLGGPTLTNDAYVLLLRLARATSPATFAELYVVLHRSGKIETHYAGPVDTMRSASTAIGLENETGAIGLPYMSSGTAHNGARFRDDYTVVYFPRPALDCSAAQPIACNQVVAGNNAPPAPNRVQSYNCSPGNYAGNEQVFALTLTETTNLTLTVNNADGRTRHAFLMRSSCNELTGCLRGGGILVQRKFLDPGTYYLVVDGAASTDVGDFSLDVQCQPATIPIACNTSLPGEQTSGVSGIDDWSCAPGMTGPENVYELTVPGPDPVTVRATLANPSSPGLRVLLSDATGFDPLAATCVTAGTPSADLWNAAPGRYLVSVDGTAGAAGTYDLRVDCERRLTCPTPPTVIDLSNPTPVSGNTTGQPNRVDSYWCARSADGTAGPVTGLTGPENIYEFDVTASSLVSFTFTPANPDLRLLILGDCYEGSCVQEGSCAQALAPGRYRLVVDGLNGAAGSYAIAPNVLPAPPTQLPDWTACPECAGPCDQTAAETRLTHWGFNSENYCGTGCDFALYTLVECGNEFHIPFRDVETGHMRIYDILRGRYVDLTATNLVPANGTVPPGCEYSETGTLVQWEDSGCTSIPCPTGNCGGGNDCRTDNQVIDVSFRGTPNTCGIYRLEFLNWGGFDWTVFANCTADETDQYYIYKDLCSALADFRPLPEIGIRSISFDHSQCAASNRVSGTVTLENLGCGPAADVEIQISQSPPEPANPFLTSATVPANGTVVVPWSYTLTAQPNRLNFAIDPSNRIRECSESASGPVQCGVSAGLRRLSTGIACPGPCNNQTPPSAGNSLKAAKRRPDVDLSWAPITATQVAAYRLFKDGDRRLCAGAGVPQASCTGATRALIQEVPDPAVAWTDAGALTNPPAPVAYYQVVGLSCNGDLEGPY